MKKIFLKFQSARTFVAITDIESARNNKRVYILFFDEEMLLKNFEIDTQALKKSCGCFYAQPTKFGIKNITKRDGNFYLLYCQSESLKKFFIESVATQFKDKVEFLILSEEPSGKNEVIEVPENICTFFQVFTLNEFFPVSYSPFMYHKIHFKQIEPKRELLSLGNETGFSIAYLEKDLITVSPNFGELESLYEIDAMDIMVNSIMGHMKFKEVEVVKDLNTYSMISDYTRRFPKVRNVNHLYSHLTNVMFDNGFIKEKGIGIIYDSISYNLDGQVLGSEIIFGSIGDFDVVGGWKPVPLPGGDIANIEPWRIALALIREIIDGDIEKLDIALVQQLKENKNYRYIFDAINQKIINYTLSSSMHHIIAALGEILSFEEATYDFDFFENKMDRFFMNKYSTEYYKISIYEEDHKYYLDTYQLFQEIINDLLKKIEPEHMVYKAVVSIANATADLIEKIMKKYNEKKVFLAGEFFKHPNFLTVIYNELKRRDLEIYLPKSIPFDDSGVSVGQLIYHYYEKK